MRKNIIVIGLGSMGRRRIRLLQKLQSDINIIGIDSNKERCKNAEKELHIVTSNSIEKATRNIEIDCAFVSTSPLSHANIINECLNRDMNVFTELNLVNTLYKENIRLSEEKNKVLFLSSTFLYRKEMEYLKKELEGKKVNYTYHVGQYLPDWHPWENYKNFFVGNKETNGCREFMAIEFPWIISVFGNVVNMNFMSGKMSNLDVDYPDNYTIMFEHENGSKGVIALDIVSRKASRNLEVFGEDIYIIWNGTPDSLKKFDIKDKKEETITLYDSINKRDDYCASIIEDAYYSEIVNFFKAVDEDKKAKYTFQDDFEVLELINKIDCLGGKDNE